MNILSKQSRYVVVLALMISLDTSAMQTTTHTSGLHNVTELIKRNPRTTMLLIAAGVITSGWLIRRSMTAPTIPPVKPPSATTSTAPAQTVVAIVPSGSTPAQPEPSAASSSASSSSSSSYSNGSTAGHASSISSGSLDKAPALSAAPALAQASSAVAPSIAISSIIDAECSQLHQSLLTPSFVMKLHRGISLTEVHTRLHGSFPIITRNKLTFDTRRTYTVRELLTYNEYFNEYYADQAERKREFFACIFSNLIDEAELDSLMLYLYFFGPKGKNLSTSFELARYKLSLKHKIQRQKDLGSNITDQDEQDLKGHHDYIKTLEREIIQAMRNKELGLVSREDLVAMGLVRPA